MEVGIPREMDGRRSLNLFPQRHVALGPVHSGALQHELVGIAIEHVAHDGLDVAPLRFGVGEEFDADERPRPT
jgi:hypothetical protein